VVTLPKVFPYFTQRTITLSCLYFLAWRVSSINMQVSPIIPVNSLFPWLCLPPPTGFEGTLQVLRREDILLPYYETDEANIIWYVLYIFFYTIEILYIISFRTDSFFFQFLEMGLFYIAQAGLKLVILLP
jgi:hypothetical protein